MRWFCPILILVAFFRIETMAWAADPSSPSFQIQGSTFVPAVADGSSAGYTLTSAIDPFVGFSQSANWNIRHGAPVKDTINPAAPAPTPTPTPTPSGGGGSGGNGPGSPPTTPTKPVPVPTLIYRSPTFASHQVIFGTYVSTTVGVIVNGSADGVELLPGYAWQRDLPLFLGFNQVVVQARDSDGNLSSPIGGVIERMLIGDINRDHRVDDLDLSLFTRTWKRYNVFADFNEDGKINDIDLSLFASHWGLFY